MSCLPGTSPVTQSIAPNDALVLITITPPAIPDQCSGEITIGFNGGGFDPAPAVTTQITFYLDSGTGDTALQVWYVTPTNRAPPNTLGQNLYDAPKGASPISLTEPTVVWLTVSDNVAAVGTGSDPSQNQMGPSTALVGNAPLGTATQVTLQNYTGSWGAVMTYSTLLSAACYAPSVPAGGVFPLPANSALCLFDYATSTTGYSAGCPAAAMFDFMDASGTFLGTAGFRDASTMSYAAAGTTLQTVTLSAPLIGPSAYFSITPSQGFAVGAASTVTSPPALAPLATAAIPWIAKAASFRTSAVAQDTSSAVLAVQQVLPFPTSPSPPLPPAPPSGLSPTAIWLIVAAVVIALIAIILGLAATTRK